MKAHPTLSVRLHGVRLLHCGALAHSPAQTLFRLKRAGVGSAEALLAFASAWKRVTRISTGTR